MAGIYIHIPFCTQACYYCDFHFSTSFKDKNNMLEAINREIMIRKNYLNNALIDTIYLGGGTPSILNYNEISSILNTINNNFKLSDNLELTLEANPEDIKPERLDNWNNTGINRISLGVQSFRNEDLKYMNRSHNSTQAIQAIKMLKKSKITNINVDLIYGFPLLDNSGWIKNLEQVAQFNIPHISCYCLTIEKKTPLFYFIKKKKCRPLDSNTGKLQFSIARNILINRGYRHYEISNFAKTKFESVHNQNYWNNTKYLGIGPSAHSFDGKSRQWNIKNNAIYCKKIENNQVHYIEEKLTKNNMLNEYILTSLRTSKGINLNYLCKEMSDDEFKRFNKEIEQLKNNKLINKKDNNILLTEKGMLLADSISLNLFLI